MISNQYKFNNLYLTYLKDVIAKPAEERRQLLIHFNSIISDLFHKMTQVEVWQQNYQLGAQNLENDQEYQIMQARFEKKKQSIMDKY